MNGLDVMIVVVLLISIALATTQGFFFEIFSLGGTIAGYLVAAWTYKSVAPWLLPYVKTEWMAEWGAFLIIFIAVMAIAGILGRLARWAVEEVGLRMVDRFLGGVFGLLRGAIVVMALLMALASFSPDSPRLASSSFAPYFLVMGRAAIWVTPYEFRDKFRAGLDALRNGHSRNDSVEHPDGAKSSGTTKVSEKK